MASGREWAVMHAAAPVCVWGGWVWSEAAAQIICLPARQCLGRQWLHMPSESV